MGITFNPLIFTGIDFTGSSGGGGGSPTIGGPVTGSTPFTVLRIDSGGNLDQVGPLTNGQLIVGSTGAQNVAATLTGTANQVIVTNGAGSITLSLPQNIAATSSPSFSQLSLNSGLLLRSQDGVNFLQDQYLDTLTLTANTTTSPLSLQYNVNNFEGCQIFYTMRQTTSNNVRTGILYISNNTASSSFQDNYAETSSVQIIPYISIISSTLTVSFINSSLTNNVTLRADVKKFRS